MSAPETIEVDGVTYVRSHAVADGLCPCCGQVPSTWTPEAILKAARAFYEAHDRAPGKSDWGAAGYEHPSSHTVYRVFGGFPEMRRQSGLEPGVPNGRREVWTREKIVEAIHAHRTRHGRFPLQLDWRHANDEHPAFTTVVNKFGSWSKGIRHASDNGTRMVQAEPIANALRGEISAGSTINSLAVECDMDASYIGRIVRGDIKKIREGYADKIICAIERPDVELLAA